MPDHNPEPESPQGNSAPATPKHTDDAFTLYDLRVEVVACRGEMVCNHQLGDYFELRGENLSLPPGQTFPIYPLAALLPLLPAYPSFAIKSSTPCWTAAPQGPWQPFAENGACICCATAVSPVDS